MKAILLGLFVLASAAIVLSQTGDDAKNLRTQLFVTDGYDKKVLPLTDQSYPIDVYVNFYLLAINGLDEVTETLKTTGYLWVSWYDEFLVWDPASYGGINYYLWPQDDLWKPDVTLQNSILEYKQLGASELKLQVWYDGEVSWYPFQVFQSTCSVDITYFPFDVQTCHLTFVAWSYTSDDVYMYGGTAGINLEQYQESSLWKVVGSSWSSEDESGEAIIKFTIKMKRKPLYFILSVIMPILMLAVLNVFVFTLPCESGERAGYAITVFLALAVFLTIVADSLPANSETIAIFAIYVIIQTLQSTLTTLFALLTIRLSTRETEVPLYLVKFTRLIQCLQCKRPKRSLRVAPERINANSKFTIAVLHGVSKTDEPNTPDKRKTDKRRSVAEAREELEPQEKVTWSTAVRAIDCVLFVVVVTTLVVSTTVCFVLTGTST